MSETKFTPGPWMVCEGNEGSIFGDLNNPIHNGDNPYIGTVAGIGVDKDMPECTANAKLIAAAPEMLNALIEISKGQNGEKKSDFIGRIRALADEIIEKATV